LRAYLRKLPEFSYRARDSPTRPPIAKLPSDVDIESVSGIVIGVDGT
jgi:hypothetical protein